MDLGYVLYNIESDKFFSWKQDTAPWIPIWTDFPQYGYDIEHLGTPEGLSALLPHIESTLNHVLVFCTSIMRCGEPDEFGRCIIPMTYTVDFLHPISLVKLIDEMPRNF